MGMAASLKSVNWFRVISTVSLLILAGLITYGAYSFYFNKPVPVINNYVVAGNMTQESKEVKQKSNSIGVFVDTDKDIGIIYSRLF